MEPAPTARHPAPFPLHARNAPLRPPSPLASFVGREREIAAVGAILRDPATRLLTLTGTGGIGKTRLALRVASELESGFEDGVAFVDLSTVRDPGIVPASICHSLGITQSGQRTSFDQLRIRLRDQHLLLILDNFEQLLPAAPLIATILTECPRLTVLATSRERLHVSGERVVLVPPLSLDRPAMPVGDTSNSPSNEASGTITHPDAVLLFVRRATEARSDFVLGEGNAPVVAAICAYLDGLPLAIELAAARVATLPPRALLARLERRLSLLAGGPWDAEPRHRTMRDAIAWSNDLLSAAEQLAFRRMAVFVDGCTLEAAEAVAAPDADTLAIVTSLVDKTLLHQEEGPDGEPRLRMLETIREFGLEQLAASDEESMVRDAHAAYILALARRSAPEWYRAQFADLLARWTLEHANLREALGWLE